MVTGDNVQTAKAVALECGILGSSADATEPNIIEGEVFRALSDTQRDEIAEKISVMGRSSPNDKLLLVQALRSKGHVVAVTGDGTMMLLHFMREPLITNIMWRNLLVQATYQVSVLLVPNFRDRSILGLKDDANTHAIKVKNTLIFNAFVFCLIIIIEFLGKFTKTVRLNWKQWIISVIIGFIGLVDDYTFRTAECILS